MSLRTAVPALLALMSLIPAEFRKMRCLATGGRAHVKNLFTGLRIQQL